MADPFVEGAGAPSPQTLPQYSVLRVPTGPEVKCLVLSSQILTVYEHYALLKRGGDGRSHPCDGSDNDPWCLAGMPLTLNGYVAVAGLVDKKRYILALSAGGADQLLREACKKGTLRGLICGFWRLYPRVNARIMCRAYDISHPLQTPEPHQVQPSLTRLWKCPTWPEGCTRGPSPLFCRDDMLRPGDGDNDPIGPEGEGART